LFHRHYGAAPAQENCAMHWIHENQMAYDPGSLGFPSILGCQAICLHTSRGLYGFHDAKSGQRGTMTPTQVSDAKLAVFANWVTGKFATGETAIALYGVINRDEQYNPDAAGNAEWKSVLLGLAGSLTFTGDVFGARINSHLEKKTSQEDKSAYVQFDLNGNVCTAAFKRWSKMEVDLKNKVTPATQQSVVYRDPSFQAENLYGSGKVAPVVRKDSSKGFNLNRIAIKQFIRFQ
jgi:hypothetical protein